MTGDDNEVNKEDMNHVWPKKKKKVPGWAKIALKRSVMYYTLNS